MLRSIIIIIFLLILYILFVNLKFINHTYLDLWQDVYILKPKEQIAYISYIIENLNNSNVDLYTIRGNAYLSQGKYIEALKDYNKAININPNNADLYYKRGLIYNYIGEYYPTAINDLEKAISLDNKKATFYFELGYAHYNSYRKDFAEKYLTKSINLDDRYIKTSYEILSNERKNYVNQISIKQAMIYNIYEDYQKAYEYFYIANKNKKIEANQIYILDDELRYNYVLKMIESFIKSGHFELALATTNQYIADKNLDKDFLAEIFMWQAYSYAGTYKKNLFKKYVNKALLLSPKNERLYDILGDIYLRIYKNPQKAIENYQIALSLLSKKEQNYIIIATKLAGLYKDLGDKIRAYSIAYNTISGSVNIDLTQIYSLKYIPLYLSYVKLYDLIDNKEMVNIYNRLILKSKINYEQKISYLQPKIIKIDKNFYLIKKQ